MGFLRKFYLVVLLILVAASIFTGGGVLLVVPVNAQDCTAEPGFDQVKTGVESCARDANGNSWYLGYPRYQRCVDRCSSNAKKNGASKKEMLDCAKGCESIENFDASGYFGCIGTHFSEASPRLRRCLCNTNEEWVTTYPYTCYGAAPKKPKTGGNYLSVLLPSCDEGITISQKKMIDCFKSFLDRLFLVGIGLLAIRVVYFLVTTAFSKGSIWTEVLRSVRDFAVGVVFIGMPTVIMTLINPSIVIFSLGYLAEFNLKADFLNPFTTKQKICENEPTSTTGGEVVYQIVLDDSQNIKFPNVVLHDCQLHITAAGQLVHKHWTLPLFDYAGLKEHQVFTRRGRQRIDNIFPRLAAGVDGVAIGLGEGDGFFSRKWLGDTWGPENKNFSASGGTIYGAIFPISSGWGAVLVGWYKNFKAASLSPDLTDMGNFLPFNPDVADDDAYARFYNVGYTEDGSTVMLVTSGGNGMFVYTFDGVTFSDRQQVPRSVLPETCWNPSIAVGGSGTAYIACYVIGNNDISDIYVIEGGGGSWEAEKIASVKYGNSAAIAIDSEDGLHLTYAGDDLHYFYKPKGGAWTKQATIRLPGFWANPRIVGYSGSQPFAAIVLEDWSGGGPRPGLYVIAAEKT